MGWAIRRADGTYRCWNANAQDDALLPGETWEKRETKPAITAPPPSDLDLGRQFDAATLLRAAILEVLDEIDARHPAQPVDRAAFRQAVIARLKA